MIGGDYFEKNIDLLRDEGRLVNIAFLKGNSVKLDLSQLMMKRINLTGSTLRPRTVEFKSKVANELRETVWPLLDRQKIGVYIDSIFEILYSPVSAMMWSDQIDESDHTVTAPLTNGSRRLHSFRFLSLKFA